MYLGADLSKMTNLNGQEYWDMSSENYCTAAVTNLEYVFGKAWFKVSAKVCYPYELWLSSIYGCDRRAQCRWIPMVPITRSDPDMGSGNCYDRHPT